MSKVLIGLVAIPVIAIGGYFGAEAYLKHRIAGEIEANFEQIRANGGQAKRGDIELSLWYRTIAISDIAVSFTGAQPASITVGRFTATGVGLGNSTTFTADSIVLSDIEASGAVAASGGMNISAKAPRFEILDYAGPIQLQGQIKPVSQLDMYRSALAQFAAIRALSMTAPTVTMKTSGTAMPGGAEYIYSDLSIRDIKDGKIAASRVARVNLAVTVMQAGKQVRMTGDMADLNGQDFDANALATVFDPAHASDTKFYRIQGPVSVGAYTLNADNGTNFRIASMRMGETRLQPAKFKLQELLAALPAAGATADPAKARVMLATVANVYEAIQIGDTEMRDMSAETPQGPVKLANIHFNLDRGKIGELAVEGLDGTTPEGPFKMGRFALKGFDFAGLMRQMSQLSVPGTTPSTDTMVGLLKGLEGIELKDLVAPYKTTKQTVNIEHASLTWGQFVGPIPSKAHLMLKMSGPIEDKDGEPFAMLREAGLTDAAIGADIGLSWDEATRKLSLTPGAFDMRGLFSLTAETTLDNVERNLFTTNPQQAAITAMLIKPGTLTLTLHDLGGLDLALAQRARNTGSTPDAVRRELLADIQTNAQAMTEINPAATRIATAAAAFIGKSRGTLTLRITPKQSMPLLQLIQTVKASGPDALSMFDIEAQSGP